MLCPTSLCISLDFPFWLNFTPDVTCCKDRKKEKYCQGSKVLRYNAERFKSARKDTHLFTRHRKKIKLRQALVSCPFFLEKWRFAHMERIFWTCSWMLFLMELNGGAFFLAADDRLNDNIIQPSCRLFSISFFFFYFLLLLLLLLLLMRIGIVDDLSVSDVVII